jgi:dTDP-4-amino-4,6-dideoxygalactose transaminase/CelD/BcsL family acetyltransferase involved in cellulose biosynthesis
MAFARRQHVLSRAWRGHSLSRIRSLTVGTPLVAPGYLRRAAPERPFPLQSSRCELFRRGRHALHAGVISLGLEPGDQVLVPAYHHGAEIEALRRAGLECIYYGVTSNLEPDPQELSDLMGPRCRALLVIHVLGFPRDAATWRRWCDERGLLLIEDAAHAWSATVGRQPVGSHGDLSIFCPYKTLPLPYISAAVFLGATQEAVDPRGGGSGRPGSRRHPWAETVVQLRGLTRLRFPPTASAELDISLGDPTSRSGDVEAFLLSRLATQDAASARRENYRLLLEQLADLVPEPFGTLPAGASPLAFPVQVPDKAVLMERLARSGIGGIDFWATPHPSAGRDRVASAEHRRRSTVVLPVHQRLTVDDLDRIAAAVRAPRRRDEKFSVQQIDDLDELRGEWSELALRTRNIFATWEWNRTWWAHFGGDRPLAVTALRDGRGSLRAVLPLYLWMERPLLVARFIGHGPGDQLGPICAPGDERAVSRNIRDLFRDGSWDVLVGQQMPAADAWGKRLMGRTLRREGYPVVRFSGSWGDTTSTWSRRLLKELRRDERRLREDHDVQVRLVSERGDLETGLDALFRLHRARWPEGTRFERREAFHREFARRAFDNGWLRLRITEVDGKPVAARLGFRYSGVESGYQSGWDPKYANYSIGVLLVADTIRAAHADGMQEYRFLRGGEAYKYRFANADPGLETVLFSRSPNSAPVLAGAVLSDTRIPRYLRSLMEKHA